MNTTNRIQALFSIMRMLILASLSLALGILAYQGLFARYLQDDYCYSAWVIEHGFWRAQYLSYISDTPYNGNRYALTLFSGLSEVLGGIQLLPITAGLTLLFWVLGLYWLLREIAPGKLEKLDAATISLALIIFTLYITPDRYQVLFWRSARLPYLLPLAWLPYLGLLILRISRKPNPARSGYLALGLLAFVVSGFSESVTAWLLALWSMLLVGGLLFARPATSRFRKTLIFTTALTICGLVVLALSPANQFRIDQLQFQRPGPALFFQQLWIFGFDMLVYKLRSFPTPLFLLLVLAAFTAWTSAFQIRIAFKRLVLLTLAVLLTLYCLSASTAAPTLLAMSAFPGERAIFPVNFALVTSLFFLAWLWSGYARATASDFRLHQVVRVVTGLLMFGLLAVYLATRLIPNMAQPSANYRSRAAAWDERHDLIQASIAAGERDLTVPAFDSIDAILELYPQAGFWVNRCASAYYEVDSIVAVEGYLDFPAVFDD